MSKHTNTRQKNKASKLSAPQTKGLLDKLEGHFVRRKLLYLLLCLSTALIFALLLFNINVSDGSDDSAYIEAGYRYATDFFNYYYSSSAPLYCMFLAIPIAIFGVNLVILKLFSVLFFVLGIYCLYIALKDRIQYIILFPALLLTALNSLFLYYASQTFTEAFVLPLSGLFFLALFRLDDVTQTGADLRKNWKKFLLLGFMTFILYLSRNVATIAIVVVVVYFMVYKKYLTALYSACSFAFFWVLYQKVIVFLFWRHLNINTFSGQTGGLFLKNSYNAGEGYEDFWGMLTRFFENAKTYSSQFFELIGIKPLTSPHSYLFFILILILCGISLAYAIAKKQKYTVAIILYMTAFLCVTFISVNTFWKQARLVMIYIPVIIVAVSYGVVMLLKTKPAKLLQWLYPAGITILLLVNISNTAGKVREHFPKLQKNIAGNKYYGMTPDWVNYFIMSEWAAKNLDKNKMIACRKASMSFVYTGRAFSGINAVPSVQRDSALLLSHYKQRFLGTSNKNIPLEIMRILYPYIAAIIIGDGNSYYTYDIPEPLYSQIIHFGIPFYTTPEDISTILESTKENYAILPDELLKYLKDKNIKYIIDASLRSNPARKTDNIINTISRYMNFVQQKYPNAFRKIHQIGTDNNEPAMIYEILYP
jgi:4-amino-4-deoxy-L-arabinose transferase-like glycosyltransferase